MVTNFREHQRVGLISTATVNAARYYAMLERLLIAIPIKVLEGSWYVSYCCTTTTDRIRPRLHVICCSVSGVMYWKTLSTAWIVVFISSNCWRNTWQVTISEPTAKSKKPSLRGSMTWNLISSMLVPMEWFTDWRNASKNMVTMWKCNIHRSLFTFVYLFDFANKFFLSEDFHLTFWTTLVFIFNYLHYLYYFSEFTPPLIWSSNQ